MASEALYKNKYVIGYRDVDFTRKLRLSALFGYFQDTSSIAVDRLGIGVDTLAEKYSVAWVLTKIRVEIDRTPSWNEEITVETWPLRPRKYEFDRDYRARDAHGNVIVSAISSWVLLDIRTREIRKSEILSSIEYPPFIEERALDCRLGKLKPFGQMNVAYKKVIGYSDTDFNGHINNARYIDYIMDCFPIENHKKYYAKSIEVNYIKEVFPGDTLVLYRDISALDSNMIYIEGVNEADGKAAFKAMLTIVPSDAK